jgi:death-on-curing protein
MNHPFTDGNKRVGFAVTDIFLKENGYRFKASPSDIYLEIMDRLETNNFKYETLIIWMKKNTTKIN